MEKKISNRQLADNLMRAAQGRADRFPIVAGHGRPSAAESFELDCKAFAKEFASQVRAGGPGEPAIVALPEPGA